MRPRVVKNPLVLTPLLTTGDVHQPAHEPVEATFAFQGSRHHFHIKLDSDPDQGNSCVCFDYRGLEDGHRTVHFRQGDTATITVGITWEKFETRGTEVHDLPNVVSIREHDSTISKEANLALKAAADADQVEDHEVTVRASGGRQQHATFEVTVE
jgi:hypothetical protein